MKKAGIYIVIILLLISCREEIKYTSLIGFYSLEKDKYITIEEENPEEIIVKEWAIENQELTNIKETVFSINEKEYQDIFKYSPEGIITYLEGENLISLQKINEDPHAIFSYPGIIKKYLINKNGLYEYQNYYIDIDGEILSIKLYERLERIYLIDIFSISINEHGKLIVESEDNSLSLNENSIRCSGEYSGNFKLLRNIKDFSYRSSLPQNISEEYEQLNEYDYVLNLSEDENFYIRKMSFTPLEEMKTYSHEKALTFELRNDKIFALNESGDTIKEFEYQTNRFNAYQINDNTLYLSKEDPGYKRDPNPLLRDYKRELWSYTLDGQSQKYCYMNSFSASPNDRYFFTTFGTCDLIQNGWGYGYDQIRLYDVNKKEQYIISYKLDSRNGELVEIRDMVWKNENEIWFSFGMETFDSHIYSMIINEDQLEFKNLHFPGTVGSIHILPEENVVIYDDIVPEFLTSSEKQNWNLYAYYTNENENKILFSNSQRFEYEILDDRTIRCNSNDNTSLLEY